jgi:PAS domain S-box-containing protein
MVPRTNIPLSSPDGGRSGPSHKELHHFFERSLDMLCIADFSGRFRRLNPAWQRALGWSLEELQARPFLDFVHPDDHLATRAEMAKIAHGGSTITFENRYQCRNGGWRWLEWTAEPLPESQEVWAIARDITRRKLLEEEILRTLDCERERIGRELHDGLCQDLAGIAALGTTLALKLAARAAPESTAAREIAELLRRAFRHTRALARGENPLHLTCVGTRRPVGVGTAFIMGWMICRDCRWR